MKAEDIKRYEKKSVPQLLTIATRHFNKFIRERDKDEGCISCGSPIQHAGHFYSGGHYSSLKFDTDNVHGQCLRCNNFLHGNLNEYRRNILNRITQEDLDRIDNAADYYKRHPFKWDRFSLIEIILKYK